MTELLLWSIQLFWRIIISTHSRRNPSKSMADRLKFCNHSVMVFRVSQIHLNKLNVRFTELFAINQSIQSKVIIFLSTLKYCTAEINLMCSFSYLFGRLIYFAYIIKTKFIETHCDAFWTHLNQLNVFRVTYAHCGDLAVSSVFAWWFSSQTHVVPYMFGCKFCIGEIFWNSLPSARNHEL
ncbi:Hypothetical_protein [Hexamita inflata]|uniref:Hypothetical_protein n=1 Tax=Hexamita inflata TaxID=28002 RepID=A0ABP1H0W6_9EUKA